MSLSNKPKQGSCTKKSYRFGPAQSGKVSSRLSALLWHWIGPWHDPTLYIFTFVQFYDYNSASDFFLPKVEFQICFEPNWECQISLPNVVFFFHQKLFALL